jgi:hypothetical protein
MNSVKKGKFLINEGNTELGEDIKSVAPEFDVVCSWCGALIRSDATGESERMCLICHARMLNDYFQRLKKTGEGRRGSLR